MDAADADAGAMIRAARRSGATAAQAKAAATPAPADKAVDLSAQFADGHSRSQEDIGSCHAFASIALLEAAVFRAKGVHVMLSEEDLFLQDTVLNGEAYSSPCSEGKCEMVEGNFIASDLQWAFEHGVLKSMSYAKFAQRYRDYHAIHEQAMNDLLKGAERSGNLFERFLFDPMAHARQLMSDPGARKDVFELLTQKQESWAVDERSSVKELLSGHRVWTGNYDYYGAAANKLAVEDCAKKGEGQAAVILNELNAGRPVAVARSLSGLDGWSQTDTSRDANHAFIFVGYRQEAGRRVLLTRNSWGGVNPGVDARQLCRVYEIDTVYP